MRDHTISVGTSSKRRWIATQFVQSRSDSAPGMASAAFRKRYSVAELPQAGQMSPPPPIRPIDVRLRASSAGSQWSAGLGGVDKFEPVSGGGDMNHAEEAFGELVVSG